MYLVLVDAHSKWMEVQIMKNITSSKTIEILRLIFATHGLPQKIVTDNGPSFVSDEFSQFLSVNGIKHIKSAPYYPSTNGLAERAVQSFKQALKRNQNGSVQERLVKFLFRYRITPHSTTGFSPSEFLMNRRLRSQLDLLYPVTDVDEKVKTQQLINHDNSKPLRKFTTDDKVF